MCIVLCASAAPAVAAEYQSVGNDPGILYDAPTMRGTRTAIAPRGMPVEVIVTEGDWVRVRDSQGSLAWMEKKALVAKRTVVATDPGAVDVHASPDDGSPVVFRVDHGVLLDLVAPPAGGWVNVRHRDGQSGFVRVKSVWGD
jgi:SH3-like domain-containing protein